MPDVKMGVTKCFSRASGNGSPESLRAFKKQGSRAQRRAAKDFLKKVEVLGEDAVYEEPRRPTAWAVW